MPTRPRPFVLAATASWIAGATALVPAQQPSPPPGSALPGYELVWSDEFDGTGAPDPASWLHELGFVRNHELQYYQPDNARLEDGLLVIEGRREQRANPRHQDGARDWRRSRERAEYTSSCLRTHGRRAWRYGVIEVRARVRCEQGLWPAIWTLGYTGGWPANGEVDVMEYYAGDILANAAWAGRERPAWDTTKTPVTKLAEAAGLSVDGWDDRFHVWRMDWDEQRIELSIDGKVLNTTRLDDVHNHGNGDQHPFRQPHELLLNLAIGGDNGGDPSGATFPSRYEVDYVRVYQKPEHRLPRVLMLGDSISMGYTPHVRAMMAEEAEIVRPTLDGPRRENCNGTNHGVEAIERWLALGGGGFDVIHFNFGLHDLKATDPETGRASNDPEHPRQADLDTYEQQLRTIAKALQATGAKLVYATTTPVPEGGVRPHRDPADVVRYNERAVAVAREVGAEIDDLYAFALPRLDEMQRPANVHFRPEGQRLLAEEVVRHLRSAIAAR